MDADEDLQRLNHISERLQQGHPPTSFDVQWMLRHIAKQQIVIKRLTSTLSDIGAMTSAAISWAEDST